MREWIAVAAALLIAGCASAAGGRARGRGGVQAAPSSSPRQRRAEYTQALLRVIGRAAPEQVGYLGLAGFDDAVVEVSLASDARDEADLLAAAARFSAARAREPDPDARVDLAILEDAARRFAARTRFGAQRLVALPNVAQIVYQGLAPLLAPPVSPAHRASAQTRVRRYLGQNGATAVVDAAIARVRGDLSARKLPPTRASVRAMLTALPALRDGAIGSARRAGLAHADELAAALERWRLFLESDVLPAARDDFRLPPELYAMNLRDHGVAEDPAALAARAHAAYDRTMAEWRALAREIAAARGLADPSPVRVLAELKRAQRTGAALQALFEQRIAEVEDAIRRAHVVTLPARALRFRAATPAETALNPAPTIDTQGFLAGAREIAVLVPGAPAPDAPPYDDFTFDAAVWPLLVHEGRPGHEMQFTTAIERGMSPARTLFAFNAANLEGWALYCEEVMRPLMPAESRFVGLQYLLMREARAFLDPELQLGRITVDEARRVLHDELGASTALTDTELERYTFRSPGQATAYFVGLEALLRLRGEVERALGPRFSPARFHDAVLHQGFAPLALVAQGVERELGVAR